MISEAAAASINNPNGRITSTNRGCRGICAADCYLLPGAPPHHHHGTECLLWDPIPYSIKGTKRITRELLGEAPALGELLGYAHILEESGAHPAVSWAPSVVSDDSMTAWLPQIEESATPIKKSKPPITSPFKSTPIYRGCGAWERVSRTWCSNREHAPVEHHHHGIECLSYDVWPYTFDKQRTETTRLLGEDVMSRDDLGMPAEPVTHYPSVSLIKRVDFEHGAEPRKSAPPVVTRQPHWLHIDIEQFGCAKITYKTMELARSAWQRMRYDEDDPDIDYYRCEFCRRWHLGHPGEVEDL